MTQSLTEAMCERSRTVTPLLLVAFLVVFSAGTSAPAATMSSGPISVDDGPATRAALDPTPELAKPAAAKAQAPIGNPLWGIPLRSLTATRERPLLSPSRRPPVPVIAAPVVRPPAAPAPKPREPDHPLLSLLGTVVGEPDSIAILLDETTKTVIRLKTGQDHTGWTLRAVTRREATFERHGRRATLAMPVPGTQAASISAPPPPPSAAGNTWMDGDGQMITPPPSRR